MTTTSECKYCGGHFFSGAKFCGGCGTALSATLLPLGELRRLLTISPVVTVSTRNQAQAADSTTDTVEATTEASATAYQKGKKIGSFVAVQSTGTSNLGNKIAKWFGIVLAALVVLGVGIAVLAEMLDSKTANPAPVPAPVVKPTQTQAAPRVQSANALPSFSENEAYAAVRQKILAAGWQPLHAADAKACSVGDSRCQGRPEMQACVGGGMANCRFLWQKDGRAIAVKTVGEDAAYAGVEQVGGVAASANYDGIVVAPREQGEQYVLRMTAPEVLTGDADCGQQQKKEIELWDQPSKLQPYVGKSVSVVGQLDCPRGGYVLRSVTISAR